MNVFTKGLYLLGAMAMISSCAKGVDYSTATGKRLFPFEGIPISRVLLTPLDPTKIKLKGYEDIKVWTYAVKVSPSYTARGYLFEGSKASKDTIAQRILFGHWLGGIQNLDSSEWEFFPEAARYAREGHVCVIPSGNYPWMTSSTATAEDIDLAVAQINDYRIGLDLLFSRSGKQPAKAMVISHDYGAMFGIMTAVADSRVGAVVIMAPTSRFYHWNRILRSIPEGEIMDTYQAAMLPYDPVNLIGELTIPLLFQYGESDQFVSKGDANTLINAATTARKDVRWYPATHNLTRHEPANAERQAWVEQLFEEWSARTE